MLATYKKELVETQELLIALYLGNHIFSAPLNCCKSRICNNDNCKALAHWRLTIDLKFQPSLVLVWLLALRLQTYIDLVRSMPGKMCLHDLMLFFIYLKDVLFSFQPILHCRFFFLTTSLTGSGTFFRFQILLVPVPVPPKKTENPSIWNLKPLTPLPWLGSVELKQACNRLCLRSNGRQVDLSPAGVIGEKTFAFVSFFLRQKNRIKSAQSRRPIWQVMCAVYLRAGVVSHHQLFNPCFIQCM